MNDCKNNIVFEFNNKQSVNALKYCNLYSFEME